MDAYNPRVVIIPDLPHAGVEMDLVGVDEIGKKLMMPKAVHRVAKVEGLTPKAANVLKQEMLARGGDAAVAHGTADWSVGTTDVLLMGTLRQYQHLVKKLKIQPFGLARLAAELEALLDHWENAAGPRRLSCRSHTLEFGSRTLVMGVLNVTPDSFFDGGRYSHVEAAVVRARQIVSEGADIVDVGGESTRPGSEPVTAQEEMDRVLPVIERLVEELSVPLSIDTCKASVAMEALRLGAHMVNDVGGLQFDPEMAAVVATHQVPVVIMHGLAEHRGRDWPEYSSVMSALCRFFRESIDRAIQARIPEELVIVDPGIGFGKKLPYNLEIIARLRELKSLGRPILLGTSRKSLIGQVLDLPVGERLEGTAATVALGIANGADIVRVHDVREMVRVARMTDAIVRCNPAKPD